MPIDTVKTRMQALGADKLYSSTLNCFVKNFKDEGLLTFWKGATPRLGDWYYLRYCVFVL